MLKADLHIHAKEDKTDTLQYTAKEVIDKASELKFDILSFTFHNALYYEEIKEYAENKGILLIPGTEKNIEGKHTLLYNFTPKELEQINHFEDIKKIKNRRNLVIAPHPFYKTRICLGRKLIKYIDLFDGIELSFLYSRIINLNKKALKTAEKFKKAAIATSDLHTFSRFGESYTLIDAEKNISSVIEAIKNNKIKNCTKPLTTKDMTKAIVRCFISHNSGGEK
jgi:predicted metal-dependent phosphoesterase TrpH